MARTERVLIVEWIPPHRLAPTRSGEGAAVFALDGAQAKYQAEEGWQLVSHTFELENDGSALFTMVFERTV